MRKLFRATLSILAAAAISFNILMPSEVFASTAPAEHAKPKDRIVSTAEIISAGDIMISETILSAALNEKNNYNFDFIFRHVAPYIKSADYAVINLETSIGGSLRGYSGFPKFNSPATIIIAAQKTGFDMFLTASNHSYDLGEKALKYRISALEKKNVDYVGTRKSSKDKLHKVVNVNGIKIGILNYARQSYSSTESDPILNVATDRKTGKKHYVRMDSTALELISTYRTDDINSFCKTLSRDIKALKKDGAQIIICYPHWSKEYKISINDKEDRLAQKMCDYGVDVIIGSHPHVVQPARIYTSKKSGKTTLCIHSLGNFVSSMNYRQKKPNAEYTEDGLMLKLKINRYKSGKVKIEKVTPIPIWVTRSEKAGKYSVIPLDRSKDWFKLYGISNSSDYISSGYQSYLRTMKLVSKEIRKYNKMI